MSVRIFFTLLLTSAFFSCHQESETLFNLVSADHTEIHFENTIAETSQLNIIAYEYLYNGSGVAVGDFNRDGLQDIFFSGNVVPNRLYLNRGELTFEDISAKAGVSQGKGWRTGVTVADVNGDGLPDIYVCHSGPGSDDDRANELFINNGGQVPTFTERAREFGIDALGTYSTQAAFFDFDLDGDLDMFLLNHARITYSPFYNTSKLRNLRHRRYGNRLYRNDEGFFKDISADAGIHGSGINFGLGISISDLNMDGWPDIYVTNDYEEQDFFYLNQKNGTFRECLKEGFRHISRFGMGSDAADFNNDGLPDVAVVDMLPEDSYRQKLLKGPDEHDKYMLLRDSGYHHQNMRNMLQMNVGNNSSAIPQFSEIAQLSGVAGTDWSWSPLFADLDNDGWKDLFITNGYLRDYTNLDFLKYTFEDSKRDAARRNKAFDTLELVKKMPSTRLRNYCFRNTADLRFENVSESWGFREQAVSGSAVYADLDNDGDNDVVVNNINEKAQIYRNNTNDSRHFIKIRLEGFGRNPYALGAKVFVRTESLLQLQENFPTRGFQSCVASELLFGVGSSGEIQQLKIHWPDGRVSAYSDLGVDSVYTFRYSDALVEAPDSTRNLSSLTLPETSIEGLTFRHMENDFVDFKHQYLLLSKLSSNGPCVAKADLNGDGFDDVYIGGAAGQSGELFLSHRNGYKSGGKQPWSADAACEDTGAIFLDVDNDGDMDLVVISGGSEFSVEMSELLRDRLYLNRGNGSFERSHEFVPGEKSNGSCVARCDFDKDGDEDLFIGGRSLPGYFPLPAYSHLVRNDSKNGSIRFTDVTPVSMKKPGMINSAAWLDIDNDSWMDLVLAGDFTPIMVFRNKNGVLEVRDDSVFSEAQNGMWTKLEVSDVDNDGDADLIAGNIGLNNPFSASPDEPMTIHFGDFNEDGQLDPVVSYSAGGRRSIYPSRDEMLEQLPYLKKKFVKYEQYAGARLEDILTPEQLSKARMLQASNLQSGILHNDGSGNFTFKALPISVQVSPLNGALVGDFDGDSRNDILIAGNFYPFRVQLGRMDAGNGILLKGTASGEFQPAQFRETQFFASGDVRSMIKLNTPVGPAVLVGINDDSIKLFSITKK